MPAYPAHLFRTLASRLPHLAAGYSLAVTVALLCRDFAATHGVPVIAWLGGVVVVAGLSTLFPVLALYRDDDILATSVLLTVITGVAVIVALFVESIIQTHSLGPAILMAVLAPFSLFVRGLLLIPLFGVLVWSARRLRRFLAPDTLQPPDGAA